MGANFFGTFFYYGKTLKIKPKNVSGLFPFFVGYITWNKS